MIKFLEILGKSKENPEIRVGKNFVWDYKENENGQLVLISEDYQKAYEKVTLRELESFVKTLADWNPVVISETTGESFNTVKDVQDKVIVLN
jgi:hypothetical protein